MNAQAAAYQSQYLDAATQAATAYHIPTSIFTALINQESSWNPYAYGAAGEIGLGQIKPSTAPGVNLWDPMQNIQAIGKTLSDLFAKFGNWRDALAGYNAGPGNLPAGYSYADKILNAVGAALPQVPQGVMDTVTAGQGAITFLSDPFGYVGAKLASWGASAAWVVLAIALIAFGLWVTIKGETQG